MTVGCCVGDVARSVWVGVVILVMLLVVARRVDAVGVGTVLSVDVGKWSSNGPGSFGCRKGVEFGIALYFSVEITSARKRS